MAAVATAPAGLGADDAARLLAPPPVEDVQFYSALTPRESLPLLAVSGVTGKAFWIGSLPQPPDEEEETDDESDGEESEEEHELDAEGAAVQVRTTPVSFGLYAHARTREKPAPTQIWAVALFPSSRRRRRRERKILLSRRHSLALNFHHPPIPNRDSLSKKIANRAGRSSRSRSFARSAARGGGDVSPVEGAPDQWLIVEDRVVRAPRVAARADAHGGAFRGSAGRPHSSGKSGGGGRTTNTSKRASTGTPGSRIAAPGRSAVSLKMLVDAGLMRPGPEALWITYLEQTWHAALDAAGAISFQDQTFYSPSAWAIHCKRLANPGKKADDGWKSVRYGSAEGPMLHDVKLQFLANGGSDTPSRAPSAPSDSPASDRKRRAGLVSGSPSAGVAPSPGRGEADEIAPAERDDVEPSRLAKRAREGDDLLEASRSVKKPPFASPVPAAPSATDMSWLAAFADPAEAEGAPERDERFAAVAPGANHASLLGRTVQVFWPSEETWHAGRVLRFDPGSGGASVLYATGDVEQGVVVDALAEKGHLFVL